MTCEIYNAKIVNAALGFEGHGIFCISLLFEFDGGGQGTGAFSLDKPCKDITGKHIRRVGTWEGCTMIMDIIKIVGVEDWCQIKNSLVRIKRTPTGVIEIGHILKDKWINIPDFFDNISKELKQKGGQS